MTEPRRRSVVPHAVARCLLALSVGGTALACAPNAKPLPSDAPFMTGTITGIGRIAEGWIARVEERPGDVSGSAKGAFRVREGTDVLRAPRAGARAEDLREGQRVRVWVTGPVMESYPVQAAARLIVIDAEAP